jgi:uncharacterized oxidoreductase
LTSTNQERVSAKLTVLVEKEPVDVLINNGGCLMREEFKYLEFGMIESMTNINLLSQITATKAVLPGMSNRKTGAIININSFFKFFGQPVRNLYSATKFGLAGFGKALRSEVKGYGVQVL